LKEMKTQNNIVVEVKDLFKKYPGVIAVNGVSFDVYAGEIFGMVGPNGAGKTTTIECIEGMRQFDRGRIRLLTLDPQRDGHKLRENIGIQFQTASLPSRIKVLEALDLFAAFYPTSVDRMRLLDQMGLTEKRNAYVAKLSGGQRQRVFIAMALLNDPTLVFMDELTTGLDPQARRAMWDLVRGIRERGKTVFLTTHFMEEAERLCDRVAIIDNGKIVALDTPSNLIASLKTENRIVFTVDGRLEDDTLRKVPGVIRVEWFGEQVVVYGHKEKLLVNVVNALEANNVHYDDLRTERPTLEDVFLAFTGRQIRD
jgi:ABC-2 type transport system ATP-binding protein